LKKTKLFIKNALILGITGVIIRSAALYYNVYLTLKLGSEGLGLFTLIFSVFDFAVTFAVSGVSFAATRLVSEAQALGKSISHTMSRCLLYALCFGGASFAALFFGADIVGSVLLGDARTIPSLRLLALELPFISLCSAMGGYFTAVQRVAKSAAAQILEQAAKMALSTFFLSFYMPPDICRACIFVSLSALLSQLVSFIYSFACYLVDLKKQKQGELHSVGLCRIAIPMALSSYVRSALVTAEHMLIPYGLRKKGFDRANALSLYGAVHGMALPIILFPYAVSRPFTSLLLPEISASYAAHDNARVKRLTERAIELTMIFSVGTGGIILFYSALLGELFYSSAAAGRYIAVLAPLIPVMYLDTTVDTVLKGMDEQIYSMRVNIIDSALSVAIVFFLVPKIGIYGYVCEILFCEITNCSLSISRLISRLKFGFDPMRTTLLPIASVFGATALSRLLFDVCGKAPQTKWALFLQILFTAILYISLLSALFHLFKKGGVLQSQKKKLHAAG